MAQRGSPPPPRRLSRLADGARAGADGAPPAADGAPPSAPDTLGMLAQAFQALDQKPKTVSVLKELAKIHVENKDKGKASDVFKKILGFQPDDAEALAYLGEKAKPGVKPPLPVPAPAAARTTSPTPPTRPAR